MLRLVADFVEEYRPSVWVVYGDNRTVWFSAYSVAEFHDLQDGISHRVSSRGVHADDPFYHRTDWALPSGWTISLDVAVDAPIGYEVTA